MTYIQHVYWLFKRVMAPDLRAKYNQQIFYQHRKVSLYTLSTMFVGVFYLLYVDFAEYPDLFSWDHPAVLIRMIICTLIIISLGALFWSKNYGQFNWVLSGFWVCLTVLNCFIIVDRGNLAEPSFYVELIVLLFIIFANPAAFMHQAFNAVFYAGGILTVKFAFYINTSTDAIIVLLFMFELIFGLTAMKYYHWASETIYLLQHERSQLIKERDTLRKTNRS